MPASRKSRMAMLVGAMMTTPAVPAYACDHALPVNIEDIRYADAAVVGRIVDYRVVQDPVARLHHRKWLANDRDMSAELRRIVERRTGFPTDYASFTVIVDEVLAGRAGARLTVIWRNSVLGEPLSPGVPASLAAGPYLIGLQNQELPGSPFRAAGVPAPPGALMVMQAPCSTPLLFGIASDKARAVRRILRDDPRR